MTAIATAIKEIISAAHERISGQRFLRRSASQRQSQWQAEPSFQPPVASASCCHVRFRNSLGYPVGIDGVGEDMLAAYEKVAKDYLSNLSCGGHLPDAILRRDLAPHAFLVCFAVPELVATLRWLRADEAASSEGASLLALAERTRAQLRDLHRDPSPDRCDRMLAALGDVSSHIERLRSGLLRGSPPESC